LLGLSLGLDDWDGVGGAGRVARQPRKLSRGKQNFLYLTGIAMSPVTVLMVAM
jgi:hypothetical protein